MTSTTGTVLCLLALGALGGCNSMDSVFYRPSEEPDLAIADVLTAATARSSTVGSCQPWAGRVGQCCSFMATQATSLRRCATSPGCRSRATTRSCSTTAATAAQTASPSGPGFNSTGWQRWTIWQGAGTLISRGCSYWATAWAEPAPSRPSARRSSTRSRESLCWGRSSTIRTWPTTGWAEPSSRCLWLAWW